MALARGPDAPAGAGVPAPTARLLHTRLNDRTRNTFFLRLPAAAAHVHGLRIMNRLADHLCARLVAGLIDRLADIHAVRSGLCLIDGLGNRVTNVFGMCL